MANDDSMTMVLVTRKDLKLSKGKLAAQCGHAAVECALKASRETPKFLKNWRENGARKIVVEAPSEPIKRRQHCGHLVVEMPKRSQPHYSFK